MFADNLISPCLWVGTALGNVFVVVLNLPVREQRESQPVLTITTGNPVTSFKAFCISAFHRWSIATQSLLREGRDWMISDHLEINLKSF